MIWTNEDIAGALRAVTGRSMTDPGFRALALANPAAAVEQAAGKPIPAGFRIQFVDNARNDLTVVLPDVASSATHTLSDAELEGVAGGTAAGTVYTGECPILLPTGNNHTACNPGYTKKPGSPAFCPK